MPGTHYGIIKVTGDGQVSMRKTIVSNYAVTSLFCMCLPFDPTPLYSAPHPMTGEGGNAAAAAKDEHAPPGLRLIDFISRRPGTDKGGRMPVEMPSVREGSSLGDSEERDYSSWVDRFAAPRYAPVDSAVETRGDALEEAGDLRREGRDEDALLFLNGLIADDDESAEAYLERAKIYLSKGVYDLAERDCREAISCRESSVEAHYNLGIACEKRAERLEATGDGARAYEKFREAIVEYKRSIWYDRGYAPAYYGLGCACSRMGMRDDARHYFQKAIENAERDSDMARRARYNMLLLGGY